MAYMGDYSRSVRAQIAEDEGALPASRITQAWLNENGIDEKVTFVKWLIRTGQIQTDEWHHTSARFNRTYYWYPEVIKEELSCIDLDRARRFWELPTAERPRTADDWFHLVHLAVMGHPHPLWNS